ncbi:MAG: hypothetical protein C0624_09140 [Desulfuromonas sp.]|nr:MAG: hypothetical protein C0624_09140 [Desulfuromonas sp.]
MESIVNGVRLGGQDYLKVSFVGHFDANQANVLINDLKTRKIETSDMISMVWDCTEMKGYDNDARDYWQNFFDNHKSKIDVVHVVSENIAYRAAARAFGIYWGIKLSVWSSYQQLEKSYD